MPFLEKGSFGKNCFFPKKSWEKIQRSAYFYVHNFDYRKVVCSNMSYFGAHDGFFRLLMKGDFYVIFKGGSSNMLIFVDKGGRGV